MTTKEAAKKYIKRGWSVIPVFGKIPAENWKEYQGRIVNENTIDLWWDKYPNANVGIVTGKISGITVIDVDSEKGGDESLKTIQFPITEAVKTPHGWHFYFKYNPDYPQGVGILPGIDIRNDGGYVVGPPSTNAGLNYEWRIDEDIVELPKFETIFRGKIKQNLEAKNPAWVEELLKGGQKEPGRNQAATRLAGHYRTKNIGNTEAFEILKGFADKCIPPMDLNELWVTIQSVYRYAGDIHNAKITEKPNFEKRGTQHLYTWEQYALTVSLDQLTYEKDGLHCEIDVEFEYPGESVFKYGPAKLNLSATRTISTLCSHLDKRFHFDWITAMDMISRLAILHEREGEPFENLSDLKESLPPAWLLRPLVIENETTILFGDGGVGKSTLALATLMSIQSGKTILGIAPRKLLKGLYLDWEASSISQARRLFGFIKGHNLDNLNVQYLRCVTPLHEMTNQLVKRIGEENIGFIVVDSVAGACGGETEKAENAIKLFNAIGALKISALLLAHVTKSNDVSQKPFGSTYWHNLARSTIEVKQIRDYGENSIHLMLLHRKNNYGILDSPIGLSIQFNDGKIVVGHEDPADRQEFSKELRVSDQIYNILMTGSKTINEIAELTDLKTKTIGETLRRNTRLFVSDVAPTKNEEKTWSLINKGFLLPQSAPTLSAPTSAPTVLPQDEILPEDVIPEDLFAPTHDPSD